MKPPTEAFGPQRRTVQFLAERACVESGRGVAAQDAGLFPTVIWVFWPPERNEGQFGCSATWIYYHDPTTPLPITEVPQNPGGRVCEHMGHLIE